MQNHLFFLFTLHVLQHSYTIQHKALSACRPPAGSQQHSCTRPDPTPPSRSHPRSGLTGATATRVLHRANAPAARCTLFPGGSLLAAGRRASKTLLPAPPWRPATLVPKILGPGFPASWSPPLLPWHSCSMLGEVQFWPNGLTPLPPSPLGISLLASLVDARAVVQIAIAHIANGRMDWHRGRGNGKARRGKTNNGGAAFFTFWSKIRAVRTRRPGPPHPLAG